MKSFGFFKLIFILTLTLIVTQPVFCEKREIFHMIINRPSDSPLFVWTGLIYSEVFRRLDIDFDVQYLPLKRSSLEVNEGRFDGEPARIYSYGDNYPNLLRVEEPVFNFRVAAMMSAANAVKLNGWNSLEGKDYYIDYPRGMMICENHLKTIVSAEKLDTVKDTKQGLKKLAHNRIDVYIDDINSIIPALAEITNELQDEIHYAGIMHEGPLYMFVHKKHQNLIPELEKIIRELKHEGLIEEYYNIAFSDYLDHEVEMDKQ